MNQVLNSLWLKASKQSEQKLKGLSLPTQKSEDYRYTSLKDVTFEKEASSEFVAGRFESVDLSDDEVAKMEFCSDPKSPILRGSQKKSVEELGVIFEALPSSSFEIENTLRNHFDCPSVFDEDLFAQLAVARATRGSLLVVPENVEVKLPFSINYRLSKESESFFHRSVLIAKKNSTVTFVEFLSGAVTGKVNSPIHPLVSGLTQVIAEEGACVHYIQIQNWPTSTHHFMREQMSLSKGAKVRYTWMSLGGLKGQKRCEVEITGSGASIEMQGATKGTGNQHFDHWIRTTHSVPDTQSSLDLWTVMSGRSRSVFNGTIKITPEALRTDAVQRNKNLLLSQDASAQTLPKLEISTDDVKCAHGATVSSVNPDQLYYLQTRGLSEKEAETMIVDGFTEPVLSELPSEGLKKTVRNLIKHKGNEG